MVVLDKLTFNRIIDYLNGCQGLSIEHERSLVKRFPDIPQDTIRSIISKHGQNILKRLYYKFAGRADSILRE
jgi:hypothetical protein